jgi:L-rhamnose mutarotase
MKKEFVLGIALILCFAACKEKGKAEDFPAIIEIVGDAEIPVGTLASIGNTPVNVYRWKNHWVLYGLFRDLPEVQREIQETCPGVRVKLYERPFYVFDSRQCNNAAQAERWSHTLMTANLVADTVQQREYMDYHARQEELFPEVARGFCNAGFQQLLVFRNDRQLMLVISIPEGESLDDLNPKTTENNPRVDEWNAIMAKYQEGIEGSLPGEAWVCLDSVVTLSGKHGL